MQYNVADWTPTIVHPFTGQVIDNPLPLFPDADGNGVVSVSAFKDGAGKLHYIQIPDATYAEMGMRDGDAFNPTHEEFKSVLDLAVPTAQAAVAFDASAGGSFGNPVTSLTWSHTAAAGSVLVVQAFSSNGTPNTISGVTYNAVSMTAVDAYTDTTNNLRETSWILLSPASGAHNVVVSASSGLIVGESQSYTGADTTTNPTSFNHAFGTIANGVKPSVTVTNVTGGALLGFAQKGNSATNGVTGGTERVHESNITNGGWGDVFGLGTGTQTYEATLNPDGAGSNGDEAQVMVLQPAAAGGGTASASTPIYFESVDD